MEEQNLEQIKSTIDKQLKIVNQDIETQKSIEKAKTQIRGALSSFRTDDPGLKLVYNKQREMAQKEIEDAKDNIKNLMTSKKELEDTQKELEKISSEFEKKMKSASVTNVKLESLRRVIRNILKES